MDNLSEWWKDVEWLDFCLIVYNSVQEVYIYSVCLKILKDVNVILGLAVKCV